MAKAQKTEASTKSSTPATIDAGTGEVLPSKLSKDELDELERCETDIRKGWGTFLDVGRAFGNDPGQRAVQGQIRHF